MKKILILVFLVLLPNALSFVYDQLFRLSGNWLEDYQNYFKVGFLILSIIGAIWLVVISKKGKNYIWLVFSILILIALLAYLYLAFAIINSSFSF